MKKMIFPAALLLSMLFSCKETSVETKTTSSGFDASGTTLPMPLSYASKVEFGSTDNMVKVMQWNKWMGERNIDSAASLLADSVSINLADGTVFNSTRDSIKQVLIGWLAAMKTVDIKFIAALPANATDMKHEWVFSWTDENYEYNDGKKEHFIIHEDYRLENGKIRQVNQYSRVVKP